MTCSPCTLPPPTATRAFARPYSSWQQSRPARLPAWPCAMAGESIGQGSSQGRMHAVAAQADLVCVCGQGAHATALCGHGGRGRRRPGPARVRAAGARGCKGRAGAHRPPLRGRLHLGPRYTGPPRQAAPPALVSCPAAVSACARVPERAEPESLSVVCRVLPRAACSCRHVSLASALACKWILRRPSAALVSSVFHPPHSTPSSPLCA